MSERYSGAPTHFGVPRLDFRLDMSHLCKGNLMIRTLSLILAKENQSQLLKYNKREVTHTLQEKTKENSLRFPLQGPRLYTAECDQRSERARSKSQDLQNPKSNFGILKCIHKSESASDLFVIFIGLHPVDSSYSSDLQTCFESLLCIFYHLQ